MRQLLALLAAAVLLVSLPACGEDEAATPAAAQTAPTTSVATTAAVTQPKAAVVAEDAILVLDDLPTGWKGTDPTDETESRCVQVRDARRDLEARAASDTFEDTSGFMRAEHFVYVYGDSEDAAQHMERLTSSEARDCYAETIRKSLREGAEPGNEIGEAKASELNVPAYGEQSKGIVITVDVDGVEYTFETFLTRIGSALSILDLIGASEEIREDLAEAAAQRLRDATPE